MAPISNQKYFEKCFRIIQFLLQTNMTKPHTSFWNGTRKMLGYYTFYYSPWQSCDTRHNYHTHTSSIIQKQFLCIYVLQLSLERIGFVGKKPFSFSTFVFCFQNKNTNGQPKTQITKNCFHLYFTLHFFLHKLSKYLHEYSYSSINIW